MAPTKLCELTELPMSVQDFAYLENRNALFISLSDMTSVARIDAYFTKMKIFWGNETETQSIIGAIICYTVTRDPWGLERNWAKSYGSRASVLLWEDSLELLLVGTDKGTVDGLQSTHSDSYKSFKSVILLANCRASLCRCIRRR